MNKHLYGNFLCHSVHFLIHEIVPQFYVYSCQLTPCVAASVFSCVVTSLRYAILSWVGSLEVHVLCLGACDLTLDWGPVLLNGRLWETTIANGRSKIHNLLSLVPYPKHVCFASLTPSAKYRGLER
jgi:hypothetical protein